MLVSHQANGILWKVPEIGDNHAWLDTQLDEIPVPTVFWNMRPRQRIACLSIDNY
jgi:LacI family transcriptional regulator